MVVLEHFYLKVIIPIKIGSFDISITNLTLSMFAGVGIFLILLIIFAANPKKVPGKRQVVVELLINFVRKGICFNMIGPKEFERWYLLLQVFLSLCSQII